MDLGVSVRFKKDFQTLQKDPNEGEREISEKRRNFMRKQGGKMEVNLK